MSSKRYPEEFKIEAVKQVTDRGYTVADVRQSPRHLAAQSLRMVQALQPARRRAI